jgi:hypothetical protein
VALGIHSRGHDLQLFCHLRSLEREGFDGDATSGRRPLRRGYHEHARHHLVDVLPKVAVTLGMSSRVTVTVQELIADCHRKTGKYHLAAVGQRTVCKALSPSPSVLGMSWFLLRIGCSRTTCATVSIFELHSPMSPTRPGDRSMT